MKLFYIFLAVLAVFTIIKIALLYAYMQTLKPDVDANGHIIKKTEVESPQDENEKEEQEYDKDW